jgi:hypothetical protein
MTLAASGRGEERIAMGRRRRRKRVKRVVWRRILIGVMRSVTKGLVAANLAALMTVVSRWVYLWC